MEGYDIIGDIHGCAAKLQALLSDLGYQPDEQTGAYRHPHRQAIFVGDLIDRGDQQLRVLETVKAMVDAGSAQIVMGNHEFNAAAYAIPLPEIGVTPEDRSYVYTGTVPVFYGHYWRQGHPQHFRDWNSLSACVDFSAVKGGILTAYRWSGEDRIEPQHYFRREP